MLYATVISVVCLSVLVSTGQTDRDVLMTPNALMLYFVQRVDKLYDQVKDLQAKISSPCRGGLHSIAHLTAEVEELKSEVRKRHIPAKERDLQAKISPPFTEGLHDIENLSAEVEKLKSEVRNRHVPTKEREIMVYFRAYLSVDKRFGVGKTVIFDKVDSNIGGGYNSTSGVFTAPISGFYEFKCSLHNKENGKTEYIIDHEGTEKAVLVLQRPWESYHMSTIIRVTAGEKVWIYGIWDNGEKPLTRKGAWSVFTGYLLRKSEL